MEDRERHRGERASFDRQSGEVRGSGSGAGGGAPGEDHDDDPMAEGGVGPAVTPRARGNDGSDRDARR